jgi:hypothetical protein
MTLVHCRVDKSLVAIALVSLPVIAWAAFTQNRMIAILAAVAFCVHVIASGYSLSKFGSSNPDSDFTVLQKSVCLSLVTTVWASAALFLAYPIAGLKWIHGWEYGLAFALAATLFASYSQRLSKYQDRPAQQAAIERAIKLAAMQAAAIAVTLAWLVASGKLATVKGDWLANDVFVASGVAILALSLQLVRSLSHP